jgi:hypothetical protein
MSEGKNHSEYLGIGGRKIYWILGKLGLGVWIRFMQLKIRLVAGFCQHGNEPLVP